MKFLGRNVLLLVVLLPLLTFAQTDSTEIQLQKYKDLYEKGLINEREYEDLKRDALKIPPAQVTVVRNTIDMKALKRTYTMQRITGGITFLGALGCAAGAIRFRHLYVETLPYTHNVRNNYLKQFRICLVFGAILTGISVFSFVKGSKNRQKYFRLSATPNNLSLSLAF